MSRPSGADAAVLMDRMYRYQRYIYDFTRKPYLLGRDLMISGLKPPAGAQILEIGCGTGRNLVRAAQLYPQTTACGLDVSAEMLETARLAVKRSGLNARIRLVQADATSFDPGAPFGRAAFDRIFISYSLSMIPVWRQVVAQAVRNLAPAGSLHIVDFGQCEQLPGWFRAGLNLWLGRFGVFPRADLPEIAREIAEAAGLKISVSRPMRGYAMLIVIGG